MLALFHFMFHSWSWLVTWFCAWSLLVTWFCKWFCCMNVVALHLKPWLVLPLCHVCSSELPTSSQLALRWFALWAMPLPAVVSLSDDEQGTQFQICCCNLVAIWCRNSLCWYLFTAGCLLLGQFDSWGLRQWRDIRNVWRRWPWRSLQRLASRLAASCGMLVSTCINLFCVSCCDVNILGETVEEEDAHDETAKGCSEGLLSVVACGHQTLSAVFAPLLFML